MLGHTLQHPDSGIRQTSQDILFMIYKTEGFSKIQGLMESLHPKILQQLIKVIPEASNITGASEPPSSQDWTQ